MYYVCSFSYKYSYKLASFTPKLRFLGAGGKKKSTLISMCNGKRTRSESKSEFVRVDQPRALPRRYSFSLNTKDEGGVLGFFGGKSVVIPYRYCTLGGQKVHDLFSSSLHPCVDPPAGAAPALGVDDEVREAAVGAGQS